MWIRIANAPVFLVRYIGKMLWPVNLACFYPYDRHPAVAWIAGSALLLGAITAVVVMERRRRPWLLVGWTWFVIALVPNIGPLQAGWQSIADRFTHLAMLGVAVTVAFAVSGCGTGVPRRAIAALVCGVIGVWTWLTWRQIGYWHDSVRLFEHAGGGAPGAGTV